MKKNKTDVNKETKLISFENLYPYVTRFVKHYGRIEIGVESFGKIFVRATDECDLIWEGKSHYKTVDGAMEALEKALEKFILKQETFETKK